MTSTTRKGNVALVLGQVNLKGAFGWAFRKPIQAPKPFHPKGGCLATIPKGLSDESLPLGMLKAQGWWRPALSISAFSECFGFHLMKISSSLFYPQNFLENPPLPILKTKKPLISFALLSSIALTLPSFSPS